MKDSVKVKLFGSTTVLLLLINIVLVGFMWFAPRPARPNRGEVIIHELNFDDAQRNQFKTLKEEQLNIIRTVTARDENTHRVLFDNLRNGQDTTAFTDSLINEIGKDRKQIEVATYHHLAQVRKMCTEEQQKKFDEIISNLMTPGNGGPSRPQRK